MTFGLSIPGPAGADGASIIVGARAYRGSDQSIPNNTVTVVALDTESFDTDAIHSGGTFTIPSGLGGKWLITGLVSWNSNATGTRQTRFLVNDSTVAIAGNAPSTNTFTPLSDIQDLSAGDTVKLAGYQNSGSSLTVPGALGVFYAWCAVVRLGA